MSIVSATSHLFFAALPRSLRRRDHLQRGRRAAERRVAPLRHLGCHADHLRRSGRCHAGGAPAVQRPGPAALCADRWGGVLHRLRHGVLCLLAQCLGECGGLALGVPPKLDGIFMYIRENPMKMDDDWGYPYFRKPPFLTFRDKTNGFL